MERACLEMGSCDDPVDMKLTQSVVAAYLEAIAEDKETVERVRLAIWEVYRRGGMQPAEMARVALAALTGTGR